MPGAAVDLTIVAHIFDVAHDLGMPDEKVLLDPAAVRRAGARPSSRCFGRRIQVWVDGRQVAGAVWSAPQLLADRQAIQLQVHYALAGGRLRV